MLKTYHITNQARIFTALILTGILSVGSCLTLIKSATANPANLSPATTNEVDTAKAELNSLPSTVANAVLRDLTNRTGIANRNLQIVNSSERTWSNGCLELPQPGEFCTQALVPGWLVVVSNGTQQWTYHTNKNGSSLRLAANNQLPQAVRNAVLQETQAISGLPAQSLRIIVFQATDWADGCDRPTFPNPCDPILISGWQVTVGSGNQHWVFLSDNSGSRIKLVRNEV
jgi:hypothetical protein